MPSLPPAGFSIAAIVMRSKSDRCREIRKESCLTSETSDRSGINRWSSNACAGCLAGVQQKLENLTTGATVPLEHHRNVSAGSPISRSAETGSSRLRPVPIEWRMSRRRLGFYFRAKIISSNGGCTAIMRRSLLTGSFVQFVTASSAAPPVVNPADPVAFMNQLWDRVVEVLSEKADPAVREAQFRELFHEDFDCPDIARFVLDRYWRAASEHAQREFVTLFEDYAVYVYTGRLGDFAGDTFKICGSRSDGGRRNRFDRRYEPWRADAAQDRLAAGIRQWRP
jgi:hypothetical protein